MFVGCHVVLYMSSLSHFFFVKEDKVIPSWVTLCSVTSMFLICGALYRNFKHHKKQNLSVHSLVLMFFSPPTIVLLNMRFVQLFSTVCGPAESTLNISPVFLREMNA